MKNNAADKGVLSVYPGNYVPMYNVQEIKNELKSLHIKKEPDYPVKIKEMNDSYTLQVEIPGVKREDFLLQAEDSILSVCMLHKEAEQFDGANFHFKDLKCNCFNKKIMLPKDTDAVFIRAEYKAGILYLVIPKTNTLDKYGHTSIVVY
jgi:HSP20 family protein